MNLSRRAFLTGAVTAVAAATLPAVAAVVPENPCKTIHFHWPLPDTHFAYYLHPAQWKFFEAEGFDMGRCVRVEMMPGDMISGDLYERQTIRLPVSRRHQKRKYGPRPQVEGHIRSFRREA